MQVIVIGQDKGQDYIDLVEFCSVRGIKLVEEKVNNHQQPHAACPEGETGRSCETCNYWRDGMCWGESCTDFSEWE